jgi:hypothetical protein
VFGTPSANETVVLFGDSHADHWSTPLVEIARKDRFRLVTYMKSSCRATRMTARSFRLKRDYIECDEWRERAIKEIVTMKPQLVIISQLSISLLDDELGDLSQRALRKQKWAEGVKSTVEALSNAGIEVVFLRDVPTHKLYLDKCVARALWQNKDPSVCDTPRVDAADDSDSAIERKIVTGIRNTRYVDLTNLFCDDTLCHAMIDGKLVFRDRHHIATPYAASLAAPLERAVFRGTSVDIVNSQPPSDNPPGPS